MQRTKKRLPFPGNLPPSDAVILVILSMTLSALLLTAAYTVSDSFTAEVPIGGGEIHEGTIGVPVYRNPLFAVHAVEQDIAALMHAGVLQRDTGGELRTHLAERWEQNGNTYTFRLKEDIRFHNGTPVTADDAVFTFSSAAVLAPIHPHLGAWEGVSAEYIDGSTVTVTVPEGNLSFPESFTLPVIPEHIWKKIPVGQWQNYAGPGVYVGAGPYGHRSETLTLDGRLKTMTLEASDTYTAGRPHITRFTFHFFITVGELLDAYEDGGIDSIHSITANDAIALINRNTEHTLYSAATNKVFGVFFNTEDGRILQDPFLRSVFSRLIDRDVMVRNVFHGHATALQAPISTDTEIDIPEETEEEIIQTLEDIGWGFESLSGSRNRDGTELRVAFAFPDTEEAHQIATILAGGWQRLGIEVIMQPRKDIRKAIEERDFDLLFYGYRAGRPKDLVHIWKSDDTRNMAFITGFGSPILNDLLQRMEAEDGDPIDKLREMIYLDIKTEMTREVPAVFLYSPHFLYILPKDILGTVTEETSVHVEQPSDRFADVHTWHTRREKVWSFLVNK